MRKTIPAGSNDGEITCRFRILCCVSRCRV